MCQTLPNVNPSSVEVYSTGHLRFFFKSLNCAVQLLEHDLKMMLSGQAMWKDMKMSNMIPLTLAIVNCIFVCSAIIRLYTNVMQGCISGQ